MQALLPKDATVSFYPSAGSTRPLYRFRRYPRRFSSFILNLFLTLKIEFKFCRCPPALHCCTAGAFFNCAKPLFGNRTQPIHSNRTRLFSAIIQIPSSAIAQNFFAPSTRQRVFLFKVYTSHRQIIFLMNPCLLAWKG